MFSISEKIWGFMTKRNRLLPHPHLKPDGGACGHASFFPTKEPWHKHGPLNKCRRCKANVSEKGGIEIIPPDWPSDRGETPLYLWRYLTYEGSIDYNSLFIQILRICPFDNDRVMLVCGSENQWNWAMDNFEKLDEELNDLTGRTFFVNYERVDSIFNADDNEWIIEPESQ